MNNNRVLIIGGNGFIGKNLCSYLHKKKYNISTIVKKNNDEFLRLNLGPKKIFTSDITKYNNLKEIIYKISPNYIINLASFGNYPEQKSLNKMINVNILGLKNILFATKDLRIDKFIQIGSSSEYGFKNHAMNESNLLEPNSYYSSTKGSATLIAQTYSKKNNLQLNILRLFSVYGPYEKSTRFIPTAIKKFLISGQVNLTPGTQKRDFIYIDDVSRAIEKSLLTNNNPGEIINIGTGVQTSNDEIIEILGNISKYKIRINKGKYVSRMWDSNNWVADIKKAKKILNWEPKINLEKGLKLSYKWWKNYYEPQS